MMLEMSSIIRSKELVQICGVIIRFAIQSDTFTSLILHNLGHLVCEEIEPRQIRIRILFFTGIVPINFGFLFVRISPIEYRIFVKFSVCNCLKWRARQMQSEFTINLIKSQFSFRSVHAFMGLVDNKNIPSKLSNLR